jgi:aspartyl-tRNA synthetase
VISSWNGRVYRQGDAFEVRTPDGGVRCVDRRTDPADGGLAGAVGRTVEIRGAVEDDESSGSPTMQVVVSSMRFIDGQRALAPSAEAEAAVGRLRNPELQQRLRTVAAIRHSIHRFLQEQDFLEVDTPVLYKPTPLGGRNTLVMSHLEPGKVWGLPKSPQTFKQLLACGDIPRYYQFAKCFRERPGDPDHMLEFTQVDLQLSYASVDVLQELVTALVTGLVAEFAPDRPLTFTTCSHSHALEAFGSDKPDARAGSNGAELAAVWVDGWPLFKLRDGVLASGRHPFTLPTEETAHHLWDEPLACVATGLDLVINGVEIASGGSCIADAEVQQHVFGLLGVKGAALASSWGFYLDALRCSTPPHATIALGLERLVAVLLGLDDVRDVVAFPSDHDNRNPFLGTPCDIPAGTSG